ncbi:hypothetical protein AS026_00545 [Rhizobium altiplani]|uniref:Uncharacterized protein n=1 Tax=Rhizobium altiplani TaxID=1864509 RepID=A0A109K3U9_9HYPH|nr:hypothetical protein AS026_00545 [Rhizobium altiplani]
MGTDERADPDLLHAKLLKDHRFLTHVCQSLLRDLQCVRAEGYAARLLIVPGAINPYGRHVADPITTASISTPFP